MKNGFRVLPMIALCGVITLAGCTKDNAQLSNSKKGTGNSGQTSSQNSGAPDASSPPSETPSSGGCPRSHS